jgi:hypothetical protein
VRLEKEIIFLNIENWRTIKKKIKLELDKFSWIQILYIKIYFIVFKWYYNNIKIFLVLQLMKYYLK